MIFYILILILICVFFIIILSINKTEGFCTSCDSTYNYSNYEFSSYPWYSSYGFPSYPWHSNYGFPWYLYYPWSLYYSPPTSNIVYYNKKTNYNN